jgi:hypothetical protein
MILSTCWFRTRVYEIAHQYGFSFKDKLDDSVSVIEVDMWSATLHLHVAVFEPV